MRTLKDKRSTFRRVCSMMSEDKLSMFLSILNPGTRTVTSNKMLMTLWGQQSKYKCTQLNYHVDFNFIVTDL